MYRIYVYYKNNNNDSNGNIIVYIVIQNNNDNVGLYTYIHVPWESKTKQRMVFRMIHGFRIPDPTKGQFVWSLDFLRT